MAANCYYVILPRKIFSFHYLNTSELSKPILPIMEFSLEDECISAVRIGFSIIVVTSQTILEYFSPNCTFIQKKYETSLVNDLDSVLISLKKTFNSKVMQIPFIILYSIIQGMKFSYFKLMD